MSNPLESKHIAPLYRAIEQLSLLVPRGCASFCYDNGVHIHSEIFDRPLDCEDSRVSGLITMLGGVDELERAKTLVQAGAHRADGDTCVLDVLALLAWRLKGWRKGPFILQSPSKSLYIDSEWRSCIKWNLLAPYSDLSGARVADVGCNNGFYMLAMYAKTLQEAREVQKQDRGDSSTMIIGFDPSGLFHCQFAMLNHLLNLPLSYELLGVQDLPAFTQQSGEKFDVIFCLGVLYHRSDVFACLKALAQSVRKGGIVFIDTLMIDIADLVLGVDSHACSGLDLVLSVRGSYAKMSNVYLLPSLSALHGWCERCGFGDVEVLGIVPTTLEEQRQTQWIDSLSLEDFLDPSDSSKTIEGYPAPKRAYIKVRRI